MRTKNERKTKQRQTKTVKDRRRQTKVDGRAHKVGENAMKTINRKTKTDNLSGAGQMIKEVQMAAKNSYEDVKVNTSKWRARNG